MNPLSAYEHPVGAYAFHNTHKENTASIQEHGIKATEQPGLNTRDADTALADLGYDNPFPFDRTNVTYCHVNYEYIADRHDPKTDTVPLDEDVTIVIDTTKTTAPMYIADMGHISDLLDYHYVGSRIMIQSDTPDEAIEQYRNSITPVETPDDIATQLTSDISHAELIIDGDIPSAAIVDIVR
ncbi:hypothetical protein [Haloarcula onubensis]|uniref:Uncharacterized protein n=1 Tax=Haloarcula onubensis TaxID=2950539 RepID=A0ABU2FTD2_9EURY|nr:hypothetical protein [Halomicroarcula sp. S3CR25-11]MDS0284028.1 hypothetical protein [Halomicroarcula sp. S3CR25-11]